MHTLLRTLLLAATIVQSGLGQVQAALPFARTLDLLVIDNLNNCVWRLADRNQDGDYHDQGEVTHFYQDGGGSLPLTFPRTITTAPDGTAIVYDAASDTLLSMRDRNGDGDAQDPGEHLVFFDNSNASGVLLEAASGMAVDAEGRVFVAAQNLVLAVDAILLLEDQNGDGDANDAGEARQYCIIPGAGGSIADSRPSEILIGPDGNVYYVENGSLLAQGVYRLTDINMDGDCNDPGEVAPFWLLPAPMTAFYIAFAVDQTGAFYLGDLGGVWEIRRAFDADSDGTISAGEQTVFFSSPTQLSCHDVLVTDEGVLLLSDALQSRIWALRDNDGDGYANGVGEAGFAYSAGVAANPSVTPRGAALLRAPTLTVDPQAAPIGMDASFVARTETPRDLGAVFLSLALVTPTDLPPWGQVELDLANLVALGFGLSDNEGYFRLTITIPNNPGLIGTFAAQALCGDDFRLFLSNGIELFVTP